MSTVHILFSIHYHDDGLEIQVCFLPHLFNSLLFAMMKRFRHPCNWASPLYHLKDVGCANGPKRKFLYNETVFVT